MTPSQPERNLSFWHPASLIATWFGAGLLPRCPGTWGTLAALPFGALIIHQFGMMALLYASIALFVVGIKASNIYMARTGKEHDPGEIVVDEVVGMWLVLLVTPRGLPYSELGAYFTAFVLFRLFDITKPWPIRLADKRIKGGLGVMLDDVLASGFAAVVLISALLWFYSYFFMLADMLV